MYANVMAVRRGIAALAPLLVVLILSRCAAPAPQPSIEQTLQARGWQVGAAVTRIPQFTIDGWTSVDDRHIVLTDIRRQSHLITLFSACPDVQSAVAIGYTNAAGSVSRGDSILVRGAGGVQRCAISEIRELVAAGNSSAPAAGN